MQQSGQISGRRPVPHVDMSVTEPQPLRFAVGAFHTWESVEAAVRDLTTNGTAHDNFNYLGLQRVLVRAGRMTAGGKPILLRELPFPGNAELISCTPGPLAERLVGRLGAGAPTLKAALGHWLIPRHAAHLQDGVEDGEIILWVQLLDNDDERRAYQCLLTTSSNSVGVHDLIGT